MSKEKQLERAEQEWLAALDAYRRASNGSLRHYALRMSKVYRGALRESLHATYHPRVSPLDTKTRKT